MFLQQTVMASLRRSKFGLGMLLQPQHRPAVSGCCKINLMNNGRIGLCTCFSPKSCRAPEVDIADLQSCIIGSVVDGDLLDESILPPPVTSRTPYSLMRAGVASQLTIAYNSKIERYYRIPAVQARATTPCHPLVQLIRTIAGNEQHEDAGFRVRDVIWGFLQAVL